MAEIIRLEYNAATEGIVAALDAVGTHGGPMAGAALPVERVTLSEMDSTLAVRWRGLLADTHDYLRTRVPAHGVVPEEVVAERAALAREREAIAQDRLAQTALVETVRAELAAADEQIRTKQAEMAALDAPAVAEKAP